MLPLYEEEAEEERAAAGPTMRKGTPEPPPPPPPADGRPVLDDRVRRLRLRLVRRGRRPVDPADATTRSTSRPSGGGRMWPPRGGAQGVSQRRQHSMRHLSGPQSAHSSSTSAATGASTAPRSPVLGDRRRRSGRSRPAAAASKIGARVANVGGVVRRRDAEPVERERNGLALGRRPMFVDAENLKVGAEVRAEAAAHVDRGADVTSRRRQSRRAASLRVDAVGAPPLLGGEARLVLGDARRHDAVRKSGVKEELRHRRAGDFARRHQAGGERATPARGRARRSACDKIDVAGKELSKVPSSASRGRRVEAEADRGRQGGGRWRASESSEARSCCAKAA